MSAGDVPRCLRCGRYLFPTANEINPECGCTMIVTTYLDKLDLLSKEDIGKKINEKIPPMFELTGRLKEEISPNFNGYVFYFEVERIMEGDQYLLWR